MFLGCVQNVKFVWIFQIFVIHSKFWVDGSCQDGSQQRFLKFVPEKFDQTYSLIASSSHVFHESWINESANFFTKFLCFIFRGLQSIFFSYDKHLYISAFLISIENLYLVEKQNKKNLWFVDSGIVKTCDELDLSEHRPEKKLKIRFVKCFLYKRDVVWRFRRVHLVHRMVVIFEYWLKQFVNMSQIQFSCPNITEFL